MNSTTKPLSQIGYREMCMWKRFLAALVALAFAFAGASHAALPFEQLLYKGKAIPFYNEPTNPQHKLYFDGITGSRLAERMADLVSASLMLKSDIGIGFEPCGQANAFFSPQRRSIIICVEFIDLVVKTASDDKDFMMKLPKQQFAQIIDGLIWGIFFHELAHAVISTNNVPITGREEDVADQFAVWFSINFLDQARNPIVVPQIWFWSRLASTRSIPSMNEQQLRSFMADEHSLDAQRIYNMACWYAGTGTDDSRRAAEATGLPPERLQRCSSEYAKLDQGMKNQFKKFFKLRPLRGAW